MALQTEKVDRVWEKRPLERQLSEEGRPEGKRQRVPAIASVIMEALKADASQKLFSNMEPLIRKVVGEEIERVLAKFTSARIGARSPPRRLQGPHDRHLRLQFRSKLALPLFTGSKVEGEQGSAIHVVLLDACTGQVVTAGPEACAKLEVIVLEGDFSVEDDEDWSEEEFYAQELREREGKRPLLTGDLTFTLKDGIGTLGELAFTDNSSWLRSRKFRLGVKVASGSCEGIRVREAKTEAFTVKDHRGELYKKHYPPALNDEVWRLDKIGKDGAFHKRLNSAGVYSVEDFLRLFVMDSQKLRNVLGNGMSSKMWEGTVEHAKTCVLSGKLYVYYGDEKHSIGVVFNNICQLMGLIAAGQYISVDALVDSEKVYVDRLVKVAYENWKRVVEYDGAALIDIKPQKQIGRAANPEDLERQQNLSSQNGPKCDPMVVCCSQPSVVYQASNALSRGANTVQGQFFSPNPCSTFSSDHQKHMSAGMEGSLSLPSHSVNSMKEQESAIIHNNLSMVSLPLTSSKAFSSSIPPNSVMHPSVQSVIDLWNMYPQYQSQDQRMRDNFSRGDLLEECFSEEEMRIKSLELLVSEDLNSEMQQLAFSNYNLQGDFSFSYHPFSPPPDPIVHRRSGRSKANVGWLKLKAALRWGIFGRRRTAARKASRGILHY